MGVVTLVILAPIVILLSPLIALAWAVHVGRRVRMIARLRAVWPPGRFVLVAYTQSELWAPFIEQSLLPRLGDAVIPIDRSKEAWRREHPDEARAIELWGGRTEYNPIAIVIRDRWHVGVFRFYEAFQQLKHGRPQDLEQEVSELISLVQEVAGNRVE